MTTPRSLQWIRAASRTEPPLGCWQWNTKHGRLSARDSAMPGPWRGEVTPQMRHWQDLVSARKLGRSFMGHRDQYAHLVEQIWLVAGTQSAKTRSFLYAALGYLVDQHPAPMALILPRLKDFKRVLDNRVRPFFNETPTLARHFPTRKSALAKAITYGQWHLDTLTLYMLCGELADDLRSFPVCNLVLDEFDLLPLDVQGQGDPIELGLDRQKTWNRTKLALGGTTPTTVDGHGWRRLCSGSHERLLIRCPACGADQELHPDQVRRPTDASPDEIKIRGLATWACAHCAATIADDGTKDRLVAEACTLEHWVPGKWAIDGKHPTGHWSPSADFDERHQITRIHPAETTIRSGQMNSLYSRFISLSEFAAHELAAKLNGNAAEWVAHVNGWRCEPHIAQIVAPPDLAAVATAACSYGYLMNAVPAGVRRIAIMCDQQGNSRATSTFPYVVRGWGEAGESWLIDTGTLEGFDALEAMEAKTYQTAAGPIRADAIAVDGGNGMMRVPLQEWASKNPRRRMLLTGRHWPDFLWRERVANSAKEKRNRKIVTGARIYNWHTNAFKTELDGMMRAITGARKWNLPDDAPEFYLVSLTAEEQVDSLERVPGAAGKQHLRVWRPRVVHDQTGRIIVREDNHWWDCEAMAPVVAAILGWNDPKPVAKTITAADWFGRKG